MRKYKHGDFVGPNHIIFLERTNKNKSGKWNAIFVCPQCGEKFEALISSIGAGKKQTCNRCSGRSSRKEVYIGEKFGKLTVINKDKIKSGTGKGNIWKCQCECGSIVYASSSELNAGRKRACKKCYPKKKTVLEAENKYLNKIYGRIQVIEKTNNKNKSGDFLYKVRCLDCKKLFLLSSSQIANRKGGCGCISPNAKNISGQCFGKLMAVEPVGRDSKQGLLWKCKCECGNTVITTANHLLTGHTKSCGCTLSHGEVKLKKILDDNNISYIAQKIFSDCIITDTGAPCRFDFYLPDYNTCIEYDGIQHFTFRENSSSWNNEENFIRTKYRDTIKNKYCKEHNIRLVRIPYYDYNKITIEYLKEKIDNKIK